MDNQQTCYICKGSNPHKIGTYYLHLNCLHFEFMNKTELSNIILEQNLMLSQQTEDNKITDCINCGGIIQNYPYWNGKNWFHAVCYCNCIISLTKNKLATKVKNEYNYEPKICDNCSFCGTETYCIKTDIGYINLCYRWSCKYILVKCEI